MKNYLLPIGLSIILVISICYNIRCYNRWDEKELFLGAARMGRTSWRIVILKGELNPEQAFEEKINYSCNEIYN